MENYLYRQVVECYKPTSGPMLIQTRPRLSVWHTDGQKVRCRMFKTAGGAGLVDCSLLQIFITQRESFLCLDASKHQSSQSRAPPTRGDAISPQHNQPVADGLQLQHRISNHHHHHQQQMYSDDAPTNKVLFCVIGGLTYCA